MITTDPTEDTTIEAADITIDLPDSTERIRPGRGEQPRAEWFFLDRQTGEVSTSSLPYYDGQTGTRPSWMADNRDRYLDLGTLPPNIGSLKDVERALERHRGDLAALCNDESEHGSPHSEIRGLVMDAINDALSTSPQLIDWDEWVESTGGEVEELILQGSVDAYVDSVVTGADNVVLDPDDVRSSIIAAVETGPCYDDEDAVYEAARKIVAAARS